MSRNGVHRRVLIVHDYGSMIGGAERVSMLIRDNLRARGYDARMFASTAQVTADPLPHVADYACHGTMSSTRKLLQIVNPLAVNALRRVMREFRPDVVHLRMFMTQLSPAILPLLRDVPALLHVVNYNLICPLNTKTLPDGSACHQRMGMACHRSSCLPLLGVARLSVQNALVRSGLRNIDRIITNSHWVRRRLEADGVRVDDVIWNGVPTVDEREDLSEQPTVCYAGRLIAKKGVDVLLKAFAQAKANVPNAQLLIAGDGNARPALEALATELQVAEQVRFLGHLSHAQLEQQLGAAWVQVAPSIWEEPFGIVAAEAMMRGMAVICTNTGGLAEQIVEDETGYAIPPRDVDAMADRLHRLLSDRARAKRFGKAGRTRALAEFTHTRMVDRFEHLYHELLQERAIGAPSAWQPAPA